jgi:FlaG/FlaF family flagellin (archaellin)
MKVTQLFTDECAVSSTLGVVLLVSITVILAAVVGGFAFGLLGGTNAPPNADFDWEFNGSGTGVQIGHDGGDTLDGDRLELGSGWGSSTNCQIDGGDQLSGGDTIVDDGSGGDCAHGASTGTELELVWESSNGETSTIVSERTAP